MIWAERSQFSGLHGALINRMEFAQLLDLLTSNCSSIITWRRWAFWRRLVRGNAFFCQSCHQQSISTQHSFITCFRNHTWQCGWVIASTQWRNNTTNTLTYGICVSKWNNCWINKFASSFSPTFMVQYFRSTYWLSHLEIFNFLMSLLGFHQCHAFMSSLSR